MIFEESYRRKALQRWEADRVETTEELRGAVKRIGSITRTLTLSLFAPLMTWFDRS